jgi:hypothetical protein
VKEEIAVCPVCRIFRIAGAYRAGQIVFFILIPVIFADQGQYIVSEELNFYYRHDNRPFCSALPVLLFNA